MTLDQYVEQRSTSMAAEASALRPSPIRRDVSIRTASVGAELDDVQTDANMTDSVPATQDDLDGSKPPNHDETPSASPTMSSHRQRTPIRAKTLGVICLAICVLGSVLQSAFVSWMSTKQSFDKPFLLLYVAHSAFLSIIPISFLLSPKERRLILRPIQARTATGAHMTLHERWSLFVTAYRGFIEAQFRGRFREFCERCFWLALLYNIPNGLWYMALGSTSIAEVTAIFNTNSFFTYLFSVCLLKEPLSFAKLGIVCIAIFGVLVIALGDGINRQTTSDKAVLGNFYCFLSAVLYGLYSVIYAQWSRKEQRVAARTGSRAAEAEDNHTAIFYTNQITGFIGLMTMLFQWILIPILHWTGLETVEPMNSLQCVFLFVNTCSSVLYNTLYMVTISLTSPIFATLGIAITIPISILMQAILYSSMPSIPVCVGAVITLAAVIAFILKEQQPSGRH